jgi:hypothetical protein
VRPGDLRIAHGGLPASIERIEDLGDASIVTFVAGDRQLKQKIDRLPAVRRRRRSSRLRAGDAHLFDLQTGARL